MDISFLEKKKSIRDIVMELNNKNVKELREICKNYNIKISSKSGGYIKKKHLINLILDATRKKKKIKKDNEIIYQDNPNGGGIYAIQGRRENMEDTYVISKYQNTKLYGVFDGHGGEEVSTSLPKLLSDRLLPKINKHNYNDMVITNISP